MPSAGTLPVTGGGHPHHQRQQFTDEELSDIFQINFAEIFGSAVDDTVVGQSSGYKGISLPSANRRRG